MISLIISLMLTGALFILLTRCLQINWERKNRHPLSFLMPAVLTVGFLYVSITLSVPCLLDSIDVLRRNYSVEEIQLQQGQLSRSAIRTSNALYHYNPGQFTFEADQNYRITYTSRSRFIVDVIDVTE